MMRSPKVLVVFVSDDSDVENEARPANRVMANTYVNDCGYANQGSATANQRAASLSGRNAPVDAEVHLPRNACRRDYVNVPIF